MVEKKREQGQVYEKRMHGNVMNQNEKGSNWLAVIAVSTSLAETNCKRERCVELSNRLKTGHKKHRRLSYHCHITLDQSMEI